MLKIFRNKNKDAGKKFRFFYKQENNIPMEIRDILRVQPSPNDPISIRLEGHELEVFGISAKGIAFKNADFHVGDFFAIQFNLPCDLGGVAAKIEILMIDNFDFCRCRFLDLTREQEDAIHRYVTSRQQDYMEEQNAAQN